MRKKRRTRKHFTKQGMTAALAVGVSFSLITGCTSILGRNAEPAAQELQAKSVKVIKLQKLKLGEPPELNAEIVSSLQFEVLAKAEGEVVEVLKRRGDEVTEGDVILRIFSKDAVYQRSKASLAVQNARDAISSAKKDQENSRAALRNSVMKAEQALVDMTRNTNKLKNDYDAGRINKTPVQEAEVQLKNAKLDLELLKQQLKALENKDYMSPLNAQLKDAELAMQKLDSELENMDITASTTGILTEQLFEKGMVVGDGKRIGVVQKMNPIKIKANVPETFIKPVREKAEMKFYLPGTTEMLSGKITYLSPVIDPQTKAYELNLEAPNESLKLMPGAKTRVQLLDPEQQIVLAVPVSSIVRKGEDAFVFVLNGNSVEMRRVELGRLSQDELNQEVLVGVKEGEQLVVSGQNHLNDKDQVQLAFEDSQSKK